MNRKEKGTEHRSEQMSLGNRAWERTVNRREQGIRVSRRCEEIGAKGNRRFERTGPSREQI
jgi:hypothetical protein